MESLIAYLPTDRRIALVQGQTLAEHTTGAALFADISGFTPLTEGFLRLAHSVAQKNSLVRSTVCMMQ
jgi:class 3 adenylate cyclase